MYKVFDDKDGKSEAPYRRWVERHETAFVLQSSRSFTPGYLVLHRATCTMMRVPRNSNQPAAFTGGKYIKVCSESVDDLRGWIRDRGASDFSKVCQICRPFDKKTGGRGWNASKEIEAVRDSLERAKQLDPNSVDDSRRRSLQAIVVRQGGIEVPSRTDQSL